MRIVTGDGSGPLPIPVRIIAGVLGAGLAIGGLVLIAADFKESPRFFLRAITGVGGITVGAQLLRAAWKGWSPPWPD
jgi:hypothetical protein